MKKALLIFSAWMATLFIAQAAHAVKAAKPPHHQTIQTIGCVDTASGNEIEFLNCDASGNLTIVTVPGGSSIAPTNGVVDIPTAGTSVQMPSLTATSCSLQAPVGNTGNIYVGGPTVTNISGANEGIHLQPGWSFGNIGVTNLNQIYVDTDNNGDDVKYLCN